MRGFYLRHQVTRYVILFIERDGSTHLTSLLMSHPEIKADYERLAVLRQEGAKAEDQLAWIRSYFTPGLVNRYEAVGFKTKLVDVLDRDGLTRVLQDNHCRVIQMHRRNFVKAVVSRINARRLYEASGKWNLYDQKDRMPAFDIDPDIFEQYLQEREQAESELIAYVDQLGLPALKIVYEDLLVNSAMILAQVFNHIGVHPFQVQSKTLKHTSDNLRDVVLNFDELRSGYEGTKYATMFDEVLVSQV